MLCTFVANIIEAADPIGPNDVTIFSIIQSFQGISSANTSGESGFTLAIIPQVFTLLLKILLWDYNFLHNFVGLIIRMLMWGISLAILIWAALAIWKR